MEENEKRAFKDLVNALAVNFRTEVSTALYQALWMGLSDIPLDKVRAAVGRALRDCEFMPTAAKLREFAGRGPQARLHYFKPADDELERIETCTFHNADANVSRVAPDHVPWCRKCRRLRLAANGAGQPQALGELLQAAALAPLDPKGEQR